jgi:hypothetical protein
MQTTSRATAPPGSLPPLMSRKRSRGSVDLEGDDHPQYPPAKALPSLLHFLEPHVPRQRSPSIESVPALSYSSPATTYAYLPSSSPPAVTPPDSPVSTHAFVVRQSVLRPQNEDGLHLLLTALESQERQLETTCYSGLPSEEQDPFTTVPVKVEDTNDS